MNARNIRFTNRHGLELSARIDFPMDKAPLACAVFAHCFTCSKSLKAVGHISRALTRNGIAVLRFDFTGLGNSEGSFSDTTFSSNVDDVVDAARYMAGAYAAPTLLIGHSLGGAAVLQAAMELDEVKAVATIGSPFDPAHVAGLFESSREEIEASGAATVRIAGRPFLIRKEFLEDLEAQRVESRLGRLDRALLIMHAPGDTVVGIDNAALLYGAAQHPKSFISLDDADHLLTDENDAIYAGSVLAAWAARYVQAEREELPDAVDHQHHVETRIGRELYRTEVFAAGHVLLADEPKALGGLNTGPNPYEFVTSGLGACTAITLRMYADRKEWPLEEVAVRLHHRKVNASECDCDMEDRKGKVDIIDREIELIGPLDEMQRTRLMAIANRCPVHRSLTEATMVVKTVERVVAAVES